MTTPTPDIELQTGSEFCVSGCYALTPAGMQYVDAYVIPGDPAALTVADAGKIVIPEAHVPEFLAAALAVGLTVFETKAAV